MNARGAAAGRMQLIVQQRGGFMLIELLVTLAILAMFGTVVAPVDQVTIQRRYKGELSTALREIHSASDEGRIVKAVGAIGYPARLERLVEGAVDLRSPKKATIYFLRHLLRDPFSADPALSDAQDLGQAQLRQRGRRAQGRRRRVRRDVGIEPGRPARHSVQTMVANAVRTA